MAATPSVKPPPQQLPGGVTRAIGPEDFVTAVVVQVATDGSAIVLNCGHPPPLLVRAGQATQLDPPEPTPPLGDRKSTRLNSSHRTISYAVFCLKKKKKQ